MTGFEELGRCTQKLKGVGTRKEQAHSQPKSWTSWLSCDISSCNALKKITFQLADYILSYILIFVL